MQPRAAWASPVLPDDSEICNDILRRSPYPFVKELWGVIPKLVALRGRIDDEVIKLIAIRGV